jgi:apolipoprotein N-acyltransferase
MAPGTSEAGRRTAVQLLAAAVVSGAALAAAFPPVDQPWLVWVGLVPLLWVVERCAGAPRAAVCGFVGGLVYALIVMHPLTSSHVWAGWASGGEGDLVAMQTRQWWFLHVLWVLLAAWGGGVFWAFFAGTLKLLTGGQVASGRTLLLLVLAPALWVVLCDWLRCNTLWTFHWAILGNSVAGFSHVRQLAALGGVWLLSGVVVAVNVALFSLLPRRRDPLYWAAPTVVACVLAVAYLAGSRHISSLEQKPRPIRAAALQFHKDKYTQGDFLASGLDRSYATLIRQSVTRDLDLLVLPESIALGAVRLDDSWSSSKPRERQVDLQDWTDFLLPILTENPTILTVGLDTVEGGGTYNSLVTWTARGPAGWYHKRRLVPFAEYQPRLWSTVASRGTSQYSPGSEVGIVQIGDLALGGFICQEVQFPGVARDIVLAGANLLVTGGNDGVFGDPAVAESHADMARIRAVESGRYMVRAMKTGVSAIIDPAGRELRRSAGSEGVLLEEDVATMEHRTLYVLAGDWVIGLSLLVVVLAAVAPGIAARRRARAGAAGEVPPKKSSPRTHRKRAERRS